MIKKIVQALVTFSIDHPRRTIGIALAITLLFALQFPRIKIDTDPENMLEPDQAERVFYDRIKRDFGIHDFIVLGITDKQGIFRTETLGQIDRIVSEILKIKGVIIEDVISLTTTDNIKARDDFMEIRPAMHQIPQNEAELVALRQDIAGNPFLHEKIVSADGMATAIYIPIQKKDLSYQIAQALEEILRRELAPGQEYHLAGLPVAEDTFGHEMFIQMAITAPLACLGIMFLLYLLLRKASFLLPPMMDAMFSVIWAMGLLIGTGFTVHIMSSMIPIFLMPIAILDDTHILSEFADRFPAIKDKRKALLASIEELYLPCFYTSITTAIGFASLALARIPPVRVFGLFCAFGIMAAWLFSMTLVPASIMLMKEERLLKAFAPVDKRHSWLERILPPIGRFAFSWSKLVAAGFLALFLVGAYGISRIQINDNPVRWFKEGHKMRVADRVMNRLFGGTYTAYLVVEGKTPGVIKQPVVMSYIARLQEYLEQMPLVGKTSSIADIVSRINFVLHNEDSRYNQIADTPQAIGQFIFLFQSSGDPDDLDNFMDNQARQANIWVQMKGGDNKQMAQVEEQVRRFVTQHPLPNGISLHWSGPTYINKVWQMIMVRGMLKAILGSFMLIFVLMVLEFRSLIMGLLSMIPLTISIVCSYGLLGLIGKDYDMPVAVCGALALGQGIDFAIHFLLRFKSRYQASGSLEEANARYFEEPARANFRTAIIISLGFLPLLASTLTPYVTVGGFFASLMTFSAMATLILLPAMMRLLGGKILNKNLTGRRFSQM